MNPIIFHQNELKQLQLEQREILRQRTNINNRIKNKVQIIDELLNPTIFKTVTVCDNITRDLDICFEFIRKNPGCSSKDISAHLNLQLKDQIKRWSINLNTTNIMTRVGNNLKTCNRYITETVVTGTPARQTTIWAVK